MAIADLDRPPPPSYPDAEGAARLRKALLGADYREAALTALLQLPDLSGLRPGLRPVLRRRAAGDAPLAVLTRLFALGDRVPAAQVEAALGAAPLAAAKSAGLLAASGDAVQTTVQLVPLRVGAQDLIIASDFSGASDLPSDHVMGLAASTRKLLGLTVRRRVSRVVDLGTGCGVHALAAAGHADQVIATDVNARAIAMARGNAQLNQLDSAQRSGAPSLSGRVTCRQGDLFAPVAGERFDLIVTNPPFVITPQKEGPRLLYRDGDGGDGLCRRLIAAAPEHLSDGGVCQALINWEIRPGQTPEEALRTWFPADLPVDVWMLWGRLIDTAEYAASWINQTERDDLAHREALHEAWMADFARRDVALVGYGLLTLRRREGQAPWWRFEEAPPEYGAAGAAVWRGLLLHDYVAASDDDTLLDAHLRVADTVRLERTLRAAAGPGFDLDSDAAYQAEGLCYRAGLSGPVSMLLASCRGKRPLHEVLKEMAPTMRQPWEALIRPCLPIVRDMLNQGLLLPASITE